MIRSLQKVVSAVYSIKSLFSSTPLERNMVRFFPNPYDDYKTGATTSEIINNDKFVEQIDDYVSNITKRVHSSRRNIDGGLYVGITGIAYMFLRLSKNPLLSDKKPLYQRQALECIKPALKASAGDETSFLLGDAGTYALATVLYKELGTDNYTEYLEMYRSLYPQYLSSKFLKCGGDEFFVGRAGYLAGALWISKELKTQIFSHDELYKLCDMIVVSGRNYAMKRQSPCPLMYHYYNTEYIGAAHGISFILQMLLSVPGYIKHNKTSAQDIKTTVAYVASLQTEDGNWPCCMEEVGLSDHKLVHWCHGAPGTVYLMAKAYLVYKDQKYRDACVKAADFVWNKGLLRKGPGLCHGVAGNGYVSLLLYRLTLDEKYLHRAKMFAEFLSSDDFIKNARLPDNPESLYEGTAGTACFLADLLVPDIAEFPFQDVFST